MMDLLFLFSTDRRTFLAARAACLEEGADLVSVHSATEDSVVEAAGIEAGYNSFWIGMEDIDVSYYRPPSKLREGNVFTGFYLSIWGRADISFEADLHPGGRPPRGGPPWY